jgi:hypothetical protein
VWQWLFSAVLYTLAVLGTIVALGRSGLNPIKAIQDLATPAPSSTPGINQQVR